MSLKKQKEVVSYLMIVVLVPATKGEMLVCVLPGQPAFPLASPSFIERFMVFFVFVFVLLELYMSMYTPRRNRGPTQKPTSLGHIITT